MDNGDLIWGVPLLPCRFSDGTVRPIGIGDALLASHEIVGIDIEIPTMLPALLRQLLLPIVVDVLGSPETQREWAQRFKAGSFSEFERQRLNDYFVEHADRFDALHPVHPFGQVADLRTAKGDTKGVGLLVATAASGNNVPLFANRTEGDSLRLALPEALRWLLHTLCWDSAAIKTGAADDPRAKGGKTTGNPTGPLGQLGVVMPVGITLYDTLLLNIPVGVRNRLGTPQWRRPSAGPSWTERQPDGLLDLWTWPIATDSIVRRAVRVRSSGRTGGSVRRRSDRRRCTRVGTAYCLANREGGKGI